MPLSYELYQGIRSFAANFLLTWSLLVSGPFIAAFEFLLLLMLFFFKYQTMSWMLRQRWHFIYSNFYHFQGMFSSLHIKDRSHELLFHDRCADAEISLANFNNLGLFAPQLLLVCCTPAWTAIWESHINSRGSGPVWWGASLCSLALTTQVSYPFIKDSESNSGKEAVEPGIIQQDV